MIVYIDVSFRNIPMIHTLLRRLPSEAYVISIINVEVDQDQFIERDNDANNIIDEIMINEEFQFPWFYNDQYLVTKFEKPNS